MTTLARSLHLFEGACGVFYASATVPFASCVVRCKTERGGSPAGHHMAKWVLQDLKTQPSVVVSNNNHVNTCRENATPCENERSTGYLNAAFVQRSRRKSTDTSCPGRVTSIHS